MLLALGGERLVAVGGGDLGDRAVGRAELDGPGIAFREDRAARRLDLGEDVLAILDGDADIVGRERVIAGSDCGFGTFAGCGKLDLDISFKKLAAMAEGAAMASKLPVALVGAGNRRQPAHLLAKTAY